MRGGGGLTVFDHYDNNRVVLHIQVSRVRLTIGVMIKGGGGLHPSVKVGGL